MIATISLLASASMPLVITDGRLKGRQTYEEISAAPSPDFCVNEPIKIRNAAGRSVSIDLYEAQSDVGFPMGAIPRGSSKETTLTRPARIVALDARTGKPLLYFTARECHETRNGRP